MADIEKFMSWRFGLFVHWGPCSVIGTELSWGRENPYQPERLNQSPRDRGSVPRVRVPAALYDQLYKYFNPIHFDADRWITTAKAAGMKYIVFTTKHHDGFCNFDSKHTDYKVTSPECPFGRDIVRELSDACHRHDFGLGYYYSQPDWRHPDYGTERHARYVEYFHSQVEELCTNYGKVDIFFFDGLFDESKTRVSKTPLLYGRKEGADWWDSERLIAKMRRWQPDMVINDRAGVEGDYETPEQRVGAYMPDRPWESNVTITKRWSYGFDEQVKSTTECLRLLLGSATGGGNFLLNVGPDSLGLFPPAAEEVLLEMGRWLSQNGESIYNTKGGPYPSWTWGGSTHRDNVVYLHVQHWPHQNNTLRLPVPHEASLVASEMLTGGELSAKIDGGFVHLTLASAHQRAVDTIAKLTFDRPIVFPE
ncbi:alpha-L-fucosidase [Terrarubrum flagellatum]|uniref:alpha-L-fucosidase n=1 Tax=Terrirubrum flagellatum TaxID=2895980 RepID=UPI00314507E0